MLRLADGPVEIDRGWQDYRVAHFIERVCGAAVAERLYNIARFLDDGAASAGGGHIEAEGEMAAQISLLLEESADVLDGGCHGG